MLLYFGTLRPESLEITLQAVHLLKAALSHAYGSKQFLAVALVCFFTLILDRRCRESAARSF